MKRVLITGAAGGIGRATMGALRAAGAQVIGLDVSADDGISHCDVRDEDSVNAAVAEAVGRLGGLDVLINGAGIARVQDSGGPPGEDALAVLDVNLLGPWRVTAAALPALLESAGRVINVASGLAYVSAPFVAAYCASKRGLAAYSDSLRLEYGDRITVTTVYPGYVRTPIHDQPAAHGLSLEGRVPAEPLAAVTGVLVRCAVGPRPPWNVATTRQGAFGQWALRHLPPRAVGWLVATRAGHVSPAPRSGRAGS